MSKAVLVMDMPKSCNKCKFFNSQYRYCDLKGLPLKRKDGKYGKTKISKERADWCPLRELPEKKPKQVPVAYSYFGAYNNGWIPCSERLPEKNIDVLTWARSTARGGEICFVGCCDNGAWFLQSSAGTLSYPTQYEVIAWQPLPEPYREEQEDE